MALGAGTFVWLNCAGTGVDFHAVRDVKQRESARHHRAASGSQSATPKPRLRSRTAKARSSKVGATPTSVHPSEVAKPESAYTTKHAKAGPRNPSTSASSPM